MRAFLTPLAAGLLLAAGSAAQPVELSNMSFDQGTAGAPPIGWNGGVNGYVMALDADRPHGGPLSVRLERRPDAGPDQKFGTVVRSIDAAHYRGKKIRFRAAVRIKPQKGQEVGLWLRIDRPRAAGPGFFDNMGDRPITSEAWQSYEIVGDVAPDAERIVFGLLLGGPGTAWMDSASLEVIGAATSTPAAAPPPPPPAEEPTIGLEAARPLTDRGLRNLEAFARLYGYVRFFHPSEEALAADWTTVALAGVQRVERARNDRELAVALREVFLPLAPTLIIDPGAAPAPTIPGATREASVAWTHTGVQLGRAGETPYASRRGPPPEGLATDETVTLDLGQGVRARMRLVLPAQGAPKATQSSVKLDKPEGFRPTGDDRTTRLADVVMAWTIFQHFYPYFDVVGGDWRAELPRALASAATDQDADAFDKTLRRLVAGLKDGHGSVSRRQPKGALPIWWDWVEGRLVVTNIGPTAKGIAPGDIVTHIDGRPLAEEQAREEALTSAPSPNLAREGGLMAIWYRKRDTRVRLGLLRADGSTGEATLTYDQPFRSDSRNQVENRPPVVAELKPGLLYIDLDDAKESDLEAALPRMLAAKAIIFDMRGYPDWSFREVLRRLGDKPARSASMSVPVVVRPDRQGWTWRESGWTLQPLTPRITAKVVFLTDATAISRAEAMLSVVEEEKLAPIVGEPTAGTNGNINPFTLPGGYWINWTGMRVSKLDGTPHHGVGILPTVPVSRTLKGVREGRDELLEAAIEEAGF